MTAYFRHVRQRPDRRRIKEEWIKRTLKKPIVTQIQADGRIRRWAWIEEAGRYLRVITLPDGETVHNAFFDRDFRQR